MKHGLILIFMVFAFCPSAGAQQQLPEGNNRWLFLCCGLPGDGGHRERLTEACEKILKASGPVLGVPADKLTVLAGDEEMQSALAEHADDIQVCTKETVQTTMGKLSDAVGPQDSCWVILLGHGSLYAGRSAYNVVDRDFDQTQFAQWASTLKCREQVFWVTIPVSGFWTRPLRAPSRVVISATEADMEFTGTEMPYALADVLTGNQEDQALEDIDGDGLLSLMDLYLAVNLEITGRFTAIERLQTEHAQLDDNGDGARI